MPYNAVDFCFVVDMIDVDVKNVLEVMGDGFNIATS